jgi:hypothetical protein
MKKVLRREKKIGLQFLQSYEQKKGMGIEPTFGGEGSRNLKMAN